MQAFPPPHPLYTLELAYFVHQVDDEANNIVVVDDDEKENFVINFCHVFPCCCGWLPSSLLRMDFVFGFSSLGLFLEKGHRWWWWCWFILIIVMERIYNLILWHLFLIKLNIKCYTNKCFMYVCVRMLALMNCFV